MLKLLSTTAAAMLFAAGAALAQSGAGEGNNAPDRTTQAGFASENERMMYEENAELFGGFFTDDTMSEMRSEEEMMAAFEGMEEDDRNSVMALCDEAMQDQDSYGDTTKGICGMVAEGR